MPMPLEENAKCHESDRHWIVIVPFDRSVHPKLALATPRGEHPTQPAL